MESMIVSWMVNHAPLLEGMAIGWACAHVGTCTGIVFHQAMKVPFLRSAIVGNPERAKAIIAEVEKELDKDIDAEAAAK